MRQSENRRYVLLDRDGTVVVDKGYQRDPSLTELFPRSKEGLDRLKQAGFGLVLVSNQSGINRGYLTEADLEKLNHSIAEALGGSPYLDAIYHCPHTPADDCDCRKPRPGMARRAAADLGFDPARAYMVGDRDCDVELGKAVGATSILVRTGMGAATEAEGGAAAADYIADDLADAADFILRHARL